MKMSDFPNWKHSTKKKKNCKRQKPRNEEKKIMGENRFAFRSFKVAQGCHTEFIS